MYLDTANLELIKSAYSLGVFKGVTTNPTILSKEGIKRDIIAKDILDIIDGELYLQLVGNTCEDFIKDYKEILKINDIRVGIKVPASFEGIKAIKEIRKNNKNIKILATVIYTVDQAILCAMAGADLVAPYVNRMENNSIDSMNVISKIRNIYELKNLDTKIIAASFKNNAQVTNAYDNGAHYVTIPYEVLRSMTDNVLAINNIEQFNKDYESVK